MELVISWFTLLLRFSPWSVSLSYCYESLLSSYLGSSVIHCFTFYRCSSCFYHLVFIAVFSLGLYLADLIMLIGIIDIVFGEVDR